MDVAGIEAEEDPQPESPTKEPPTLKYVRLTNDVATILKMHATSCLALHPKFVCIGTILGAIRLVDHQGYEISNARPLQAHSVAVNCLDIDEKGDYVASCSADGFAKVSGFYKEDSDYSIQMGRLVKAIAIDPLYGRVGKRFITGDERLVLHEKTFLSWKSTVLCDEMIREGSVHSIKWSGHFVAWSSELGVRVYDLQNRCSLGFMKWLVKGKEELKNFKCNLAWTGNILLIGWVDTVRVCIIRKRGPQDLASAHNLPEFMVEPQCTFTTDFYISGVAPLGPPDLSKLQIVLLGFPMSPEEDGSSGRPTLQVVKPMAKDYIEVASPDELLLKEYKNFKVTDYSLEHIAGDNRYFVVSPRNIIIASVYDSNDLVEWLLKHDMYEEALQAVKDSDKFTIQQVGSAYIDHLISKNEFEKAGKICADILGSDKKLWEEKVYTLARLQQLKSISAYLPIGSYCLEKQVYEMVLYEYLKTDTTGFLELLKKWPPTLYKVPAVVNTVIEHVMVSGPENPKLLEALALLYSHDGKFDMALKMYLKLKHADIFEMIDKYKLYSSVLDYIVELIQLDPKKAVDLFLNKIEHFPVDTVTKTLQNHRALLYQYLDALETKDTNAARNFHGQLVQLHAQFGREKLLRFLRRSDRYNIEEALRICQERNFYPEIVHLLQCMGRSKQALEIILNQLKDIGQAIEFCKQQDDHDLWQDLIGMSLDKPVFISYLLNNIGTAVDPAMLVDRIAPGLEIDDLKSSLTKMMKDYGLQVSVQEGCKRILTSDNVNLQGRLIAMSTRGYLVPEESTCVACTESVMHTSRRANILVFFCRHVVHSDCLSDGSEKCPVCVGK